MLEDKAILIKCYISALYRLPKGQLFVQLVDLLSFYMSFPINDHTGEPLSEEDITAVQYEKLQQLQRLFFKHVPKLRELALANCGTCEYDLSRSDAWFAAGRLLGEYTSEKRDHRLFLISMGAAYRFAVEKRQVLSKELAALTGDELRNLVTAQLR